VVLNKITAMKHGRPFLLWCVLPFVFSCTTVAPPQAKRVPHKESLYGSVRVDDYFWLRQKDTPDVVAYLNAENAYTHQIMRPTERLQDALYQEMLGRIQETDASVPTRDHGYFYYSRTEQGKQYRIHCRKSAAGAAADDRTGATTTAKEEVLLDLNELAQTHKFVALGSMEMSDDQQHMAYSVDLTGYRQYTLHFKDLRTGVVSPEEIPRVDAVVWAADGRTVFYVVEDPVAKRAHRLYRHVVGTNPKADPLVYEEKDERFDLALERTRSEAYLILTSASKTTSEVRVLRSDRPDGTWQVIERRQRDHEYYVDHRGDRFYIRTNSPATVGGPKARNFRLVTAPVDHPARAQWQELIPHDDNVMLESVGLFANFAVLHERADALPRLRIVPLGADGLAGPAEEVKMPETLHSVDGGANPEFSSTTYRFQYESPITPRSTYDYDMRTHALTLLKRDHVLGGFDPSRYETARVHATASDGTEIPVSLVYKKGLRSDRAHPNPMLLYGYGSYGVSMPLSFSSNRISLLDRGVVYAIAHIRGGGDLGKRWHEEGRMATKMNTFTDFIACGEQLVRQGWTSSDRMVIQGGSAGGLLMGAVTNLRPDLWKAVVAQVPFVDVINTMLDESIPLTVGEFEEWGNPKNKDEYEVMIRYSPYDNVKAMAYPAMLVMTSYNDSQVMYWEPAKWVAKLRRNKTDSHPLLMRINMDPAGHGGQSGRYNQLHENAFLYSFVLTQLGVAQ
jgi:oligopeptidase B